MPEVPFVFAEVLRATHERALAVGERACQDAEALPPGPLAEAARRLEATARGVVLLTRPAVPGCDQTVERPGSLHDDTADAR